MKANENKIKDRENSKSDLISFSSNLKLFFYREFPLISLFCHGLHLAWNFSTRWGTISLSRRNPVAWWVLRHFQLFALTKNPKHKAISLYTSFFVIMATRKSYKHKGAVLAVKIKFPWPVPSRRTATSVYGLIAFERDGELYLWGTLRSGIQNWIERDATDSLSRSRFSSVQKFILWIPI